MGPSLQITDYCVDMRGCSDAIHREKLVSILESNGQTVFEDSCIFAEEVTEQIIPYFQCDHSDGLWASCLRPYNGTTPISFHNFERQFSKELVDFKKLTDIIR